MRQSPPDWGTVPGLHCMVRCLIQYLTRQRQLGEILLHEHCGSVEVLGEFGGGGGRGVHAEARVRTLETGRRRTEGGRRGPQVTVTGTIESGL